MQPNQTKKQKISLRPKTKLAFLCLFALLILSMHAQSFAQETHKPAEAKPKNIGENTGLPIPRFASLKSNHINARSGPGDSYPVKAVYKRAGLPVEIVSEFKLWREIVDIEGEHNWVHKAMLSGNRTAIVKEDMYAYSSRDGGSATAKLEKNAQVRIKKCEEASCELLLDNGIRDLRGWVDKSKLWGVYQNEVFD